jgi:hypothetical protein
VCLAALYLLQQKVVNGAILRRWGISQARVPHALTAYVTEGMEPRTPCEPCRPYWALHSPLRRLRTRVSRSR